jgi:hypothetical protein
MPGFRVDKLGDESRLGNVHPVSTAEFYTSYSWEIESLFDLYDPLGSNNRALIYLKDATLPTFIVNSEKVMGANLEYKFAKSVAWEDVKLTWYDSTGLFEILTEWRKQIWTSAAGLKPPNSYKRESILRSYLDSGEDSGPVQIFRLKNSWPSSIRHGELSYTSSEIKIVEVSLSYDWAEEEVEGSVRSQSTP